MPEKFPTPTPPDTPALLGLVSVAFGSMGFGVDCHVEVGRRFDTSQSASVGMPYRHRRLPSLRDQTPGRLPRYNVNDAEPVSFTEPSPIVVSVSSTRSGGFHADFRRVDQGFGLAMYRRHRARFSPLTPS